MKGGQQMGRDIFPVILETTLEKLGSGEQSYIPRVRELFATQKEIHEKCGT